MIVISIVTCWTLSEQEESYRLAQDIFKDQAE